MTTITTLLVAYEALNTTVLLLCTNIHVNLCQVRQSAICLLRPHGDGPQVVFHISVSGRNECILINTVVGNELQRSSVTRRQVIEEMGLCLQVKAPISRCTYKIQLIKALSLARTQPVCYRSPFLPLGLRFGRCCLFCGGTSPLKVGSDHAAYSKQPVNSPVPHLLKCPSLLNHICQEQKAGADPSGMRHNTHQVKDLALCRVTMVGAPGR